jgi:geranylgeranyl pyrophosphate synthase
MAEVERSKGLHKVLYRLNAAEADSFGSLLAASFEEALAERVRGLPSHRDLVDYATRAGHRTRPIGCLLACAAVGGDWTRALDAAVGVEFVHKSSVVRDDIVDEDEVRSGQPAMHVVHGVPAAIATSDLLWSIGLKDVAALGEKYSLAITGTLHEMALGQLEDVAPSPDASAIDRRMLVEERKTGALSEFACRLGAMVGGGSTGQVESLSRYGRLLGTAFQVLNDVRNISGLEAGRSAASDVRLRRDTVVSAYARAAASPRDQELLEAIRKDPGELSTEQVQSARSAILASGASEFGEKTALRLMEEAHSELQDLPPSVAQKILASLTQDALLAYAF